MLHVTNGDAAVSDLRSAGAEGDILPWRDALQEGPVTGATRAEFRATRAAFIAERGWAPRDEAEAGMRARDERVERALAEGEQLTLWFEHDLYDQLQLLDVLSLATVGARVELVQAHDFLAALAPSELADLWAVRQVLAPESIVQAHAAWAAFRAGDRASLATITVEGLPFVRPALDRLLEDRPTDGLARSDAQILDAVAAGAQDRIAVFLATQAMEEAPFAGDQQVFDRIDRLASGPGAPLVRRPDGTLTLAR